MTFNDSSSSIGDASIDSVGEAGLSSTTAAGSERAAVGAAPSMLARAHAVALASCSVLRSVVSTSPESVLASESALASRSALTSESATGLLMTSSALRAAVCSASFLLAPQAGGKALLPIVAAT